MMKNKNLLIGLCSVPLLLSISTSMTAQDLRERTYYYEILEPRHEPKPEIKGFATERIKENLDRGLTATPSANGKGIYGRHFFTTYSAQTIEGIYRFSSFTS